MGIVTTVQRHWVPAAIHSEGTQLLLLMLPKNPISNCGPFTYRVDTPMYQREILKIRYKLLVPTENLVSCTICEAFKHSLNSVEVSNWLFANGTDERVCNDSRHRQHVTLPYQKPVRYSIFAHTQRHWTYCVSEVYSFNWYVVMPGLLQRQCVEDRAGGFQKCGACAAVE